MLSFWRFLHIFETKGLCQLCDLYVFPPGLLFALSSFCRDFPRAEVFRAKVFSPIYKFFLLWIMLLGSSLRTLPSPGVPKILYCVLFYKFYGSVPTCESTIHWELIFVLLVRFRSKFPAPFIEKPISSLSDCFSSFIKISWQHICVALDLGSLFGSADLCTSSLHRYHAVLIL